MDRPLRNDDGAFKKNQCLFRRIISDLLLLQSIDENQQINYRCAGYSNIVNEYLMQEKSSKKSRDPVTPKQMGLCLLACFRCCQRPPLRELQLINRYLSDIQECVRDTFVDSMINYIEQPGNKMEEYSSTLKTVLTSRQASDQLLGDL